MKPVVTWIVLANTRTTHVLVNRGPGKGVVPLKQKSWRASPARAPRDRAGVGHNIAGPGVSAVENPDPQTHADMIFAKEVADRLHKALEENAFDRWVIVAGPHMLGLLRTCIHKRLHTVLIGEIAKDLSAQSPDVVEKHVGEVLAV